jgi:hypothetical protein
LRSCRSAGDEPQPSYPWPGRQPPEDDEREPAEIAAPSSSRWSGTDRDQLVGEPAAFGQHLIDLMRVEDSGYPQLPSRHGNRSIRVTIPGPPLSASGRDCFRINIRGDHLRPVLRYLARRSARGLPNDPRVKDCPADP